MELMIVYFVVALAVSFLCSVLEAVLLSTPMSFIAMKEDEGARLAPLLRRLKTDIDDPIAAILSLNTIAHTLGAAGVGAEAVKVFGEEYFGAISAVLTLLILVLSEIIPKTIGANYWRSLALPAAGMIRVMIVVCYPMVWFSRWITRLVSKHRTGQTVSREEVSAMLTMGVEEGVFAYKEHRMMQHLIHMDRLSLTDIMTPLDRVVAASADLTLNQFYAQTAYRRFSRIPVYGKDHEYITGYVLRQTLLEKLAEDRFELRLDEIKRPVLSFVEGTDVSQVWEKMLDSREHMVVVMDDYGCCLGIVTMEDVIEAMLGLDIVDEKEKATPRYRLTGNPRYQPHPAVWALAE